MRLAESDPRAVALARQRHQPEALPGTISHLPSLFQLFQGCQAADRDKDDCTSVFRCQQGRPRRLAACRRRGTTSQGQPTVSGSSTPPSKAPTRIIPSLWCEQGVVLRVPSNLLRSYFDVTTPGSCPACAVPGQVPARCVSTRHGLHTSPSPQHAQYTHLSMPLQPTTNHKRRKGWTTRSAGASEPPSELQQAEADRVAHHVPQQLALSLQFSSIKQPLRLHRLHLPLEVRCYAVWRQKVREALRRLFPLLSALNSN